MAKIKKEVLRPHGKLDALNYYSKVSIILKNFLKAREIATVIHIPPAIRLLRRATKLGALYAEDIKSGEKLLKFRAEHHLKDAKGKFSGQELKLWQYFFPRKLIELHYAVNTENTKSKIDRVYIDVDRGRLSPEKAQEIVLELIRTIRKDKDFNKKIKYKFFIVWTGNSFHLYLLLRKKISHNEFMEVFSLEGEFLKKWAAEVEKKTRIKVRAAHEKKRKAIILDTSQSPPGKLARAPFSLYISRKSLKKRIIGVAVPLSEKQLKDKNLAEKLQNLTPEKILNNLGSYKKLL